MKPIATEHAVDGVVAGLPGFVGGDTKRGLNIGAVEEGGHLIELVAERRIFTFFSNVVRIQTSLRVGFDLAVASATAKVAGELVARVALLAGLDARRNRGVHHFGGEFGNARLVVSAIFFATDSCHSFVVLILNDRSNETISSSETSQVDLDGVSTILVGIEDGRGSGGSVVSTIAFTDDEEFVSLELGVLLKKFLNEGVVVMADLLLIAVGASGAGVGVTNTGGLIEPENGGFIGPTVGIGDEVARSFVHETGTVLTQGGETRGTAGTTGKPDDQLGGGLGGFDHPVEVVLGCRDVDVEVAGVLLLGRSALGPAAAGFAEVSGGRGRSENCGKKNKQDCCEEDFHFFLVEDIFFLFLELEYIYFDIFRFFGRCNKTNNTSRKRKREK